MDKANDILPGTIESYCLGLLNAEENLQFEEVVMGDAELNKQVNDFMLTLESFALYNAIDPGEEVKSRTLM